MEISVIIPTYKRTRDLDECLGSILAQSELPVEVLVVDNGDDAPTRSLVSRRKDEFARRGVRLDYLENRQENSLTVARNLGVKATHGEIIIFLDDDVILDKDYVRGISAVYRKQRQALGVQGYIKQERFSLKRNFFRRMFCHYHLENNRCRALPSVSATYPARLDRVIGCEWLSGANHSFKRRVYGEFFYDENLKKYSDGEDLEFSYRVFKKYPGSLFITPAAKLVHKSSPAGRAAAKEFIYMRQVYGWYLFCKLFGRGRRDRFCYVWSRAGELGFTLARVLFSKDRKAAFAELKWLAAAFWYCWRHRNPIKAGRLDFFNDTVAGKKTVPAVDNAPPAC
ncbi:MAG: glycosyltransferase [Candidatus Pacebacteria bacterium]|jgi:glycosyltransferase involved in cell wall biosynthesis|nr:glycosyltransferase [Candidatus Paceibacterota bacterium]